MTPTAFLAMWSAVVAGFLFVVALPLTVVTIRRGLVRECAPQMAATWLLFALHVLLAVATWPRAGF